MRRTDSRASQTRRCRVVHASLEGLETRRLLASVALKDGVLKISDQTAALTVTASANNQFHVVDGATDHGVFNVAKGLEIKGTKSANVITVGMNGFAFAGTVSIRSGEGDDDVAIKGGGSIVGEVNVQTDDGDDDVAINSTPGSAALAFGNKLKITDSGGSDGLIFGNDTGATSVAGKLEVSGYGAVDLDNGATDSFGGDVTISVDRPGSVLNVNQGQVGGSEIVTVAGNMEIKGGDVNDKVHLRGMVISGNLKVDLGNAVTSNSFAVSSSAGSQTVVNGKVQYEGGNQADNVDFSSGITHSDATFNLKEGDDSVNLGVFVGPTLIDGNLKINAGSGNDTFAPINAQIGGDVNLELGNGNHAVTFDTGSSVGGTLRYHSGSGSDSLTLRASQVYVLDANFGGGSDTLTLDNAGALLKGRADGGGGVDTFNLLAGSVDPTFVLVGFP